MLNSKIIVMVQVAEKHINVCNFLQTSLQCYNSKTNNDLWLLEQISDNIHV